MIRAGRPQKRSGPGKGLLRCLFVFLPSAAVIFSISTLILSWAVTRGGDSPTGGGGGGIPSPEGWSRAPQPRDSLFDDTDGSEAKPAEPERGRIILAAAESGSAPRTAEAAPRLRNPGVRSVKTTSAAEINARIGEAAAGIGGAATQLPARAVDAIGDDGPRAKRPESEQRKATPDAAESESNQPARKGRRLLTYRRFGGRLNNQLIQFVTGLQHAKVLNRTFVVPHEYEDIHWTGMFDGFGIWDLEGLNRAYDIDWATGVSAEFPKSIPRSCVLSLDVSRRLLNGGPKLWEEWDRKCPDVIDLDTHQTMLFCGRQHQFCGDYHSQMEAYRIYEHIRLAPSLMRLIPSRRQEFRDGGYDQLAIHSRRAGEGNYDWEFCVEGNQKTCKSHTAASDQPKVCDYRTMAGNCAIWLDLDYQIKSRSALRGGRGEYRFVLASDGTHDWSTDFGGQFVVANNAEWLRALERRVNDDDDPAKLLDSMAVGWVARRHVQGQKDLSRLRAKLDSLTTTLLDLFSLVDSKYLLGAYYSTLSLNACLFRGLDRIYDSNMCWILMHPTGNYGVLPPPEESANVHENKRDDDLPVGLMTDIEHAFVRSNDGNFIAIDRYPIQLPGRKGVIAVLGDGLVPMTFVKNKKGEETIRADFTCSLGDDRDSPATVVLLKGNRPYSEHYHAGGSEHRTPFTSKGDRFRTMIILCEKLRFNVDLSRHPPLILRSRDDEFSLTIGSAFQRPVNGGQGGSTLVHCLGPVFGLRDPRWIIEYLEYHRAAGVSHVHVYNVDLHSPEIQSALQAFRDEKFITRHDWSREASDGFTTGLGDRARSVAQTDCALRSRGIFDYALFSDIDEIAVGGESGLRTAVEKCSEAKNKGKIACSFNSITVSSIYTKLDDEEEMAMKDKLILERYSGVEAEPRCPFNCKCTSGDCSTTDRKFHYGRQKYMANVRDLAIPPRPMWTHAISCKYSEMDQIMEVLTDDVMHVRRYNGPWYANENLLDTMDEKDAPLPSRLMESVRSGIKSTRYRRRHHGKRTKASIYSTAKDAMKSNAVEWIKTVERHAQYHKNKTSELNQVM